MSILVKFDEQFPGAQTIFLNRNYRSSANILRVANTLIDHNQNRIKKSLHYTLYAYVNSNLMNGVTDSTSVDYVLTVWQKGLIGVDVLFGVLTVLCLALYIRKARKIRKEQ